MPLKLYRYILSKFSSTFAAALSIFTVLFLMDQASRQVEQLAPNAGNLKDFLLSFLLLIPPLLAYTIPLAFLMAMIGTLEQMKQEREITAITATGTSPVQLLPPFAAASVIAFIVALMVTLYAGPASVRKYNEKLTSLARKSFVTDLKPGLFFTGIPDTLLLVGGFDRISGRIDGLLIVRNSPDGTENNEMILAKRGVIEPPSGKTGDIILQIEDGTIHPVSAGAGTYRSGSFKSLTSRIQSQPSAPAVRFHQKLMAASNGDLLSWFAKNSDNRDAKLSSMYSIEFNKRFALPVTILLYPFIVFPAAVSTRRHGKMTAFTSSLLLFLTSFFLFSIGSNLARKAMIPAALGAWFPAIFLGAAALAVFPAYLVRQRSRS